MNFKGPIKMVNERYDDKPEGQDESEYHFSDDQVNYDMEPEVVKDGAAAAVAAAPKASITDKLKQNRRIGIGIVIFIMLIALVYKMVSPSTTEPSTEIVQQQSIPVSKPTATVAATPPAAPAEAAAPAPVEAAAPAPVEQPQQPAPPAAVAQAQPPAPEAQSVPQPPAVNPVASQAPPSAPAATMPAAPATPEAANVKEAVAALEQQNATAMNLIQTQMAQKMTDNENQVNEMRTQIQELNARIASMEVAFHQLTKILRNQRGGEGNEGAAPPAAANNSEMENPNAPVKVMPGKVNYTVQAIIPGRAWLKSDSGDTVTVAEGDVIKDFGKITRIDPYDGIVNIDTGRKMVTLSYGMSGD